MFGNTVESIPAYLFYATNSSYVKPNITSVIIGNSVTKIGNYAFNSCANLKYLSVPSSVTNLGTYPFGMTGSSTKIKGFVLSADEDSAAYAYAIAKGITVTYDFEKPTTVNSVAEMLEINGSTIAVSDKNGNPLTAQSLVGTDATIAVTDSESHTKTYVVVYSGDIDGDGQITTDDSNIIEENMFDCALTGVYLEAADINQDKTLDAFDWYYASLLADSYAGNLKYHVTEEQTITSIKASFGDDISVYDVNGILVTDITQSLGAGTRIDYQRNGLSLNQYIVIDQA